MPSLFSDLSSSKADGAMPFAKAENKKRPGRYLAGIFLFVALAACTAVPSVASAARGHELSTPIGAKGSAAGQLTEPSAVAVNEATGDVYVLDTGNDRVDEFEANGTFVRAWGGGVAVGGLGGFEVCGPNTLPSTECQKGVSGEVSPGEFGFSSAEAEVSDIAIDNDPSSPSNGDVYVADPAHNAIDKFSATGEYLTQVSFASPVGVAVDTTGELWAATLNSPTVVNYPHAATNEFGESESRPLQAPPFFARAFPGFAVGGGDDVYAHVEDIDKENNFANLLAKYNSAGEVLEEPVGGDFSPPQVSVWKCLRAMRMWLTVARWCGMASRAKSRNRSLSRVNTAPVSVSARPAKRCMSRIWPRGRSKCIRRKRPPPPRCSPRA